MNEFRYNECARMIVSMSISINYVELIKLLHEKMGTDGENIQLDISGKYPFSFQGDFQKSFGELPKFFAAFQYSNLGTVMESRAFHRFCLRNLKSNFQSQFPNRDLSNAMRAATAHKVRKFEALMWKIQEENREAYEYLMPIPLNKWIVSHDDGKRWEVLTTNRSESFNGFLKKAPGLPVTAMIRLSLEQIVELYTLGHEAYWPSPSFLMRSNEFYCRPNRARTTRIPNEMDRDLAI
ncbi:hypothetical protein H5410_017376 [Solanum commersonii]|uniref:Uncharacterized protein n=1 Tax=Solanum commersonii TaxID=4109 RepID=A0A9J5ZZ95_SOLCO|nr:hypothetical protein H5410_017376 [Solanum commersonii]